MKKKRDDETSRSTLSIALADVSKKYGSAAVKWLKDIPNESPYEFIPSGSISVDNALGGGFVRGRLVEIYGEPASGKSTLAMSTVAQATKMGLKTLYVDVEMSLDTRLPGSYGVDPSLFILEDNPVSAEEHFDIVEKIVGTGEIGVCVIDSLTALQPAAEGKGDVGDNFIGLLARFLSQQCRRLIKLASETNTLFIFINQTREKIGVYGDTTTTPGGGSVKFYSTHRIRVSGGSSKSSRIVNEKGIVVGHQMSFTVIKNKIAAPFRSGEINLIYGQGYDCFGELVDLGESLGIIGRKGAWFDLYGTSIQGKDGVRDALASSKELSDKVQAEVRKILSI